MEIESRSLLSSKKKIKRQHRHYTRGCGCFFVGFCFVCIFVHQHFPLLLYYVSNEIKKLSGVKRDRTIFTAGLVSGIP